MSEVGFGTWTISTGWWGEKTDAEAVAMLRRALDEHGVTFFDAADAYGNGRAERQLAEAFRGRRSEVVIATKVGYDIYDEAAQKARRGQSELPMRTDPAFIRFAVDKCLERLETDYIDVLQLHNAKMEHVRDRELWDTMRAAPARGKDSRVGRGVRAGNRLAVRSRGAGGARAGHQHDPDDLERARAASGHGDDRGREGARAELLLQHSRDARVGHARGEVHGGHGVPRERPPAPSPALVARQRRQEG